MFGFVHLYAVVFWSFKIYLLPLAFLLHNLLLVPKVPDERGDLVSCGFYDTQVEAAKVADIARPVQHMILEQTGCHLWGKSLIKKIV